MQAYSDCIASKIMMWFQDIHANCTGANQALCKIIIKTPTHLLTGMTEKYKTILNSNFICY